MFHLLQPSCSLCTLFTLHRYEQAQQKSSDEVGHEEGNEQQKNEKKKSMVEQINDIQSCLRLNFHKAEFAVNNTDKSKAYNVMQKIFGPNHVEIKDFFQCLWCKEILHCVTRGETAPLIRHITEKCGKRPTGYVLPKLNMHLTRRNLNEATQSQKKFEYFSSVST